MSNNNNIYNILNNFNKVAQDATKSVTKSTGTKPKSKLQENVEQVNEKYMGFKKTVAAIKKGGSAETPEAVAAAIGRKKYGKKKFQQAAARGKKLGESTVSGPIDFDKVLDAIAALYGDDIWENEAMQDLANDLEQAGPTDRELDFIIAKGKLPKRLAGMQFSAGDDVRFGEGMHQGVAEGNGDPEITPGMKTQYGTVVKVDGNTVTVKTSNGDMMTMNIHDVEQAMAEGAMPPSVIKAKEHIRLMSDADKRDYFKGKTTDELKALARRHGYGANSNVYAKYATEKIEEKAPPGAKAERMVKHIKAGYAKDGQLTNVEKGKAYGAAWKAHSKGDLKETIKSLLAAGYSKEQIVEGFEELKKDAEQRHREKGTGKFDRNIDPVTGGTVYTRKYDPKTGLTYSDMPSEEPKRGRGRPKKSAFESTVDKMVDEAFGDHSQRFMDLNPDMKKKPNMLRRAGKAVAQAGRKVLDVVAPGDDQLKADLRKRMGISEGLEKKDLNEMYYAKDTNDTDIKEMMRLAGMGGHPNGHQKKLEKNSKGMGEEVITPEVPTPQKQDPAGMEEGNLFTHGLEDDDVKIGQKIPGTNAIKTKDIDTDVGDLVKEQGQPDDAAKQQLARKIYNLEMMIYQTDRMYGQDSPEDNARLAALKAQWDQTYPGEDAVKIGREVDAQVDAQDNQAKTRVADTLRTAKRGISGMYETEEKDKELCKKCREMKCQCDEVSESLKLIRKYAGLKENMGQMPVQDQNDQGRMSINTSMDSEGHKNLTITAEGETAVQLLQMLKLAGMAGGSAEQHGHSSDEVVVMQTAPDMEMSEEKDSRYEASTTPEEEVYGTDVQLKGGNGDVAGQEKTMRKSGYQFGDNNLAMRESMGNRLMREYKSLKKSVK
jgi:hypothetical protein